jgi:hypothetical protein
MDPPCDGMHGMPHEGIKSFMDFFSGGLVAKCLLKETAFVPGIFR